MPTRFVSRGPHRTRGRTMRSKSREDAAMSVPTESEVQSWTSGERAEVARLLDHLIERPTGTSGIIRRRRLSIVAAAIGALAMLPWIGYLASSLPLGESGGAWRMAWVGFDIMLAIVLMTTAWLGFHRR